MEVKVYSESSEIISSGNVIVPSDDYVQFELYGLRFRFAFVQESTDENAEIQITKSVETDQTGQQCLTILFSNVKNSFFGSFSDSIQVATIEGRSLSVRLSILSIIRNDEATREDKILFYTWYLSNKPKEEK